MSDLQVKPPVDPGHEMVYILAQLSWACEQFRAYLPDDDRLHEYDRQACRIHDIVKMRLARGDNSENT